MNKLNIGIIGLGTVGSGVIEAIEKNKNEFLKKYNLNIKICGISARKINKKRSFNVNKYKWYKNPMHLVSNPEIQLIVELIGGSSGIAFEISKKALTQKKHLVTANKAMLALHGNKLSNMADKYGVTINFEAAVAGGIPIINLIQNSLLPDRISSVYGILNGTCNYILTQMYEKKLSFQTALQNAQKEGFAEADPSDDVSGSDTAYKLLILSNLLFGNNANHREIYKEGITNITSLDLEMANKLGYTITLLGISNLKSGLIQHRVHPCLVLNNSLIARVRNELNTVVIEGNMANKMIIIGKGAGKKPTSSAVLSDIINFDKPRKRILNNLNKTKIKSVGMLNRKGKFYLRMGVLDSSGVLADITTYFKSKKISISSMFQLEKKIEGYIQLIFVTHNIEEKQLRIAIKKIEKIGKVKTKVKLIRIENNL